MIEAPGLERLAPLQPMRFLHLVYLFMALLGGALLGRFLLHSSPWRWSVYTVLLFGSMATVQVLEFPGDAHLEMPWRTTANPWLRGFAWVRVNTPEDAYFALDPFYMNAAKENFHGFRALAERSQLSDETKDGAVVTQVPSLGPDWARQQASMKGWKTMTAADLHRLRTDYGVAWTVRELPAPAGLDCPYRNEQIAVCLIP